MRLQNSVIILLAYPALSQACWFFGDARNGLNTVGHAIGRVVGVIGHVPQKWDKIDWSKLQHDAQADADKIKSTFSRWGSWAEEQLDGLKKDVQHDVQQGYEVYQDFFQHLPQTPEMRDHINNALQHGISLSHRVKLRVLHEQASDLMDTLPLGSQDEDDLEAFIDHLQVLQDNQDTANISLKELSAHNKLAHLSIVSQWARIHVKLEQLLTAEDHIGKLGKFNLLVSNGFPSTWHDIRNFATEHFQLEDVKDFIIRHPIASQVLAGIMIGGGSLLVGPTLLVGLLLAAGFGPNGPIAGSAAARIQGSLYGAYVPRGSIFASLQRMAMVGGCGVPSAILGGLLIAGGAKIIYIVHTANHEKNAKEEMLSPELD